MFREVLGLVLCKRSLGRGRGGSRVVFIVGGGSREFWVVRVISLGIRGFVDLFVILGLGVLSSFGVFFRLRRVLK